MSEATPKSDRGGRMSVGKIVEIDPHGYGVIELNNNDQHVYFGLSQVRNEQDSAPASFFTDEQELVGLSVNVATKDIGDGVLKAIKVILEDLPAETHGSSMHRLARMLRMK